MGKRSFIASILAAGCIVAMSLLILSIGTARTAQMNDVKASMADLKAQTAKLGAPKIEGTATVAGKNVPDCTSAPPRWTTTLRSLTLWRRNTVEPPPVCEGRRRICARSDKRKKEG